MSLEYLPITRNLGMLRLGWDRQLLSITLLKWLRAEPGGSSESERKSLLWMFSL